MCIEFSSDNMGKSEQITVLVIISLVKNSFGNVFILSLCDKHA